MNIRVQVRRWCSDLSGRNRLKHVSKDPLERCCDLLVASDELKNSKAKSIYKVHDIKQVLKCLY